MGNGQPKEDISTLEYSKNSFEYAQNNFKNKFEEGMTWMAKEDTCLAANDSDAWENTMARPDDYMRELVKEISTTHSENARQELQHTPYKQWRKFFQPRQATNPDMPMKYWRRKLYRAYQGWARMPCPIIATALMQNL